VSATDGFRHDEISSTVRSIDFVFLPGKQYGDVVTQRPLECHAYYLWGWSNGRLLGASVLRLASWVVLDLNDGVWLEHQTSRRLVPCDDGTVGEYGLSPGNRATEQLKYIVETCDLAYLETFSDAGPTLFGSKSLSYIDHILAQRGLARESRAWASRTFREALNQATTQAFPKVAKKRALRGVQVQKGKAACEEKGGTIKSLTRAMRKVR